MKAREMNSMGCCPAQIPTLAETRPKSDLNVLAISGWRRFCIPKVNGGHEMENNIVHFAM